MGSRNLPCDWRTLTIRRQSGIINGSRYYCREALKNFVWSKTGPVRPWSRVIWGFPRLWQVNNPERSSYLNGGLIDFGYVAPRTNYQRILIMFSGIRPSWNLRNKKLVEIIVWFLLPSLNVTWFDSQVLWYLLPFLSQLSLWKQGSDTIRNMLSYQVFADTFLDICWVKSLNVWDKITWYNHPLHESDEPSCGNTLLLF